MGGNIPQSPSAEGFIHFYLNLEGQGDPNGESAIFKIKRSIIKRKLGHMWQSFKLKPKLSSLLGCVCGCLRPQ